MGRRHYLGRKKQHTPQDALKWVALYDSTEMSQKQVAHHFGVGERVVQEACQALSKRCQVRRTH